MNNKWKERWLTFAWLMACLCELIYLVFMVRAFWFLAWEANLPKMAIAAGIAFLFRQGADSFSEGADRDALKWGLLP